MKENKFSKRFDGIMYIVVGTIVGFVGYALYQIPLEDNPILQATQTVIPYVAGIGVLLSYITGIAILVGKSHWVLRKEISDKIEDRTDKKCQ